MCEKIQLIDVTLIIFIISSLINESINKIFTEKSERTALSALTDNSLFQHWFISVSQRKKHSSKNIDPTQMQHHPARCSFGQSNKSKRTLLLDCCVLRAVYYFRPLYSVWVSDKPKWIYEANWLPLEWISLPDHCSPSWPVYSKPMSFHIIWTGLLSFSFYPSAEDLVVFSQVFRTSELFPVMKGNGMYLWSSQHWKHICFFLKTVSLLFYNPQGVLSTGFILDISLAEKKLKWRVSTVGSVSYPESSSKDACPPKQSGLQPKSTLSYC